MLGRKFSLTGICVFVLLLGLAGSAVASPAATAPETVEQAACGPEAKPADCASPEQQASAEPTQQQALDAGELAQLEARDEEPGDEVVGGALSNEHLTYIVIALATAIIVLLAVK